MKKYKQKKVVGHIRKVSWELIWEKSQKLEKVQNGLIDWLLYHTRFFGYLKIQKMYI